MNYYISSMLNKMNKTKESIGTPAKRETLNRCTQPVLVCIGVRGPENGMIPTESRISTIEMNMYVGVKEDQV